VVSSMVEAAQPLIVPASGDLDEIAIRDSRGELTWRQLQRLLDRVVGTLQEGGVEPGSVVAIFAENSLEAVLAHLAGAVAGMRTVPINFHLTAGEVKTIMSDSGARVLFVGPENAGVGVAAAGSIPGCTVLGWRCAPDIGVADWASSELTGAQLRSPAELVPLPNLLYTSGTTGTQKATELPPTMFVGGASILEHLERLRTSASMASGTASLPGVHLVVGPLYHTGPLCAYRLLAGGTPVVVMGRFDPERTLAAIDEFRVASTSMVPTHFRRLLALPEQVRRRYDVSSVGHIWTTGAACPAAIKRAVIDWFGPVVSEAYGATEVGTVTAISAQEWLEHPDSVGKCIEPFSVVVIDDDGKECAVGEVGRLYFRDATGRGVNYVHDPVKSAAAHISPGVFTLGEVGRVDSEGYVYITDRVSDMVISGGVNIYPAEVENVLSAHPEVSDVAVIGVPDPDMAEAIMALVVVAPGATPSEAELIGYCRSQLAHYKCPRSVTFVDSLHRTEVGKLDKRRLRAPFWPTDRTIG
jgi:long-chain acyl-CoA synthetase